MTEIIDKLDGIKEYLDKEGIEWNQHIYWPDNSVSLHFCRKIEHLEFHIRIDVAAECKSIVILSAVSVSINRNRQGLIGGLGLCVPIKLEYFSAIGLMDLLFQSIDKKFWVAESRLMIFSFKFQEYLAKYYPMFLLRIPSDLVDERIRKEYSWLFELNNIGL